MASEGEEDRESSHSEEDKIVGGQKQDPHPKEVWLTDQDTSDERSIVVVGQPQQDLMLEEMERDHKDHTQDREMQDQVVCLFLCACV